MAIQALLTLSLSTGAGVAAAWFDRLTMSGGGASCLPRPLTLSLSKGANGLDQGRTGGAHERRSPKIARPTRTTVAPSSIATA